MISPTANISSISRLRELNRTYHTQVLRWTFCVGRR